MADDFNKIEQKYGKYSKHYSEKDLFDKVLEVVKSAGLFLAYQAFQLWHVMLKPECPLHVKTAIIGALGYLIFPIDAIPDCIPVVGFSDDAAAIGTVISAAINYIDDDVKEKAKETIDWIFGAGTSEKLD